MVYFPYWYEATLKTMCLETGIVKIKNIYVGYVEYFATEVQFTKNGDKFKTN